MLNLGELNSMFTTIKCFSFSPDQHLDPTLKVDKTKHTLVYFTISPVSSMDIVLGNDVILAYPLEKNVLIEGIASSDISCAVAPNILYGMFWTACIIPNTESGTSTELGDKFKELFPEYVEYCTKVHNEDNNAGLPNIIIELVACVFSPNSMIKNIYPTVNLPTDDTIHFEFTTKGTHLIFMHNGDAVISYNINKKPFIMSAIAEGMISNKYAKTFILDYINAQFIKPFIMGTKVHESAQEFKKVWPEYVTHQIAEYEKLKLVEDAAKSRTA